MFTTLLGTKLGQTQMFTENGKRIPVTTIQAGPCWITHVSDMGGYRNIELGFGSSKHLTKAELGHIKKAGLTNQPRFLRSVRLNSEGNESDVNVGKVITVGEVFTPGDSIRVIGTSKGKGFAGVVKRHGFAGGPRTHGQSDRERAPGSIGQTTTPGRVYRGKRMAGRMGGDRITVGGLKVVSIDTEKNILTIKGLVPGARNGLVIIQKV